MDTASTQNDAVNSREDDTCTCDWLTDGADIASAPVVSPRIEEPVTAQELNRLARGSHLTDVLLHPPHSPTAATRSAIPASSTRNCEPSLI